jgi:hypothetical protein
MAGTSITNEMAENAAFNRIFDRLAKLATQASDQWTLVESDQVAEQTTQLKAIVDKLKEEKASVKSFGALQDAFGVFEMSLNEVVSETAALVEDIAELLGTLPGYFTLMTREEKSETIKNVLIQTEFKTRLLPSILTQEGAVQTKRCEAILALEITDEILGLLLALIVDVAIEAMTEGAPTRLIVGIAIAELIMFILALAISILSYKDCIAG